jgi:hypothetical protein
MRTSPPTDVSPTNHSRKHIAALEEGQKIWSHINITYEFFASLLGADNLSTVNENVNAASLLQNVPTIVKQIMFVQVVK